MYLYLDDEGTRVDTACFVYLLSPEQLQDAVGELRRATGGLERWIIPALEWNSASSAVRDEHPDTFKVIPGLLKTYRDLPVAKKWQRVRADYFANAAERDARKAAEAATAAAKPPNKQSKQREAKRTSSMRDRTPPR